MSTPGSEPASPTNGHRTFRIVVSALLRAGVKAIPLMGSALDQATFGMKDSFSSAEVRDLLDRIVKMLEQYEKTTDTHERAADEIAVELLRQPEVCSVIRRLDSASASTRRVLASFLAGLESQMGATNEVMIDVRRIALSVEDTTHRTLQSIRESQSSVETQYRQIQDSLSAISETLAGTSLSPERTLYSVYKALSELDVRPLRRAARTVRRSLELADRGRVGLVTVDFAVMHDYAYSPYRRNAEQSFSVAALRMSKQPVFILPGTIREANDFLTKAYNEALDRTQFRHVLEQRLAGLMRANSDADRDPEFSALLGRLADIVLERNSPIQRLKRLFDEERVLPWSSTPPSADELRPYIEIAWTALMKTRPDSANANRIDAENLSVIAYHNFHSQVDADQLMHLTTSRLTREAAGELQRLPTAVNQHHRLPFTLDPFTWAFMAYAAEHELDSEMLLGACNVLDFVEDIESRRCDLSLRARWVWCHSRNQGS